METLKLQRISRLQVIYYLVKQLRYCNEAKSILVLQAQTVTQASWGVMKDVEQCYPLSSAELESALNINFIP